MLPTGLGASAVNLRFMTVCGLSPARSSAALALYLLAESAGRVGLLAALLVPPVGAVFGLLARRAAKEKELAPHPLSTAAIVVGTFVTGVAVLYLLAPALSTVAFLG